MESALSVKETRFGKRSNSPSARLYSDWISILNFARLAWRNIEGSSFRSGVVLLCTMVVAGFALAW